MRWGKSKQKRITLEEWIQISKKSQFDETFSFLQYGLHYAATIDEKIDVLNYVLTVLREDLKYSLIAEVIYKEEAIDLDTRFFPDYKTLDGTWENIKEYQSETTKEIVLSEDCVIGIPWKPDRIWEKVTFMLKEPFIRDSNHQAIYFPELKVCFVLSGNHSIAVGVIYKKGVIKANECSIIPAFAHLKSDGDNWINSHTNEILEPVKDFRIAAMYEIARLIQQYEEKVNADIT